MARPSRINDANLMALAWTTSLSASEIASRAAAVLLNYSAARWTMLPALVAVSGVVSFGFIRLQQSALSMPVLSAKLIAKSVLFFANFAIQRKFIVTMTTS